MFYLIPAIMILFGVWIMFSAIHAWWKYHNTIWSEFIDTILRGDFLYGILLTAGGVGIAYYI